LPGVTGEDIFYKRVFAYLRSLPRGKVFAYILVGATNHYPFYGDETKAVYPEYIQKLPFPSPVSLKARMANTTYLQDYFFGQMYWEEFKKEYSENSHAIVLGDHSSPIEEHPGNSFFLSGAYQENFVTSMAVLPAKNSANQKSYAVGKKVRTLYSYRDVVRLFWGCMG
jgi:phosphoglycerol transferase MdoB-like AlkP superfamily enzyme